MTAKQEADSERLGSGRMQALLDTSRAELQKASEAAIAANDRECSLQQQIATLKAKIGQDSTSQSDIQSVQTELELARQQKAALQAQIATAGDLMTALSDGDLAARVLHA